MNHQRNIIGRRISRLRALKSLTQKQLAARAQFYGSELDREKISKMEAGIRSIADLDLWHLSLALGVGVDAFLEGLKPERTLGSLRHYL
jgi:transcriptional regulator with XRE-family HTH domain